MPADEMTARQDLRHLLASFHGAVVSGVRAYLTDYSATAHRHRLTTRRSITRDDIVYQLRDALDGIANVRIVDRNQTTYVMVGDRYRVLVKKSDETGFVELAKTQASFDFQSNDTDLFSYDLTNLYLSYVPNVNDPDNPTVCLICPSPSGYFWVMELEPPAADVAGEISRPPTRPDEGGDLVRIPGTAKPAESE